MDEHFCDSGGTVFLQRIIRISCLLAISRFELLVLFSLPRIPRTARMSTSALPAGLFLQRIIRISCLLAISLIKL